MAAYGGAVGLVLPRAGTHVSVLAPGAAVGIVLLLAALVSGRWLGPSLVLCGGTYVAFLVVSHPRVDAAAPLVAVCLLLSGELVAWSLDERVRLRTDPILRWRRAGAIGLLALGGLALATLTLALTAAPSAHGLVWTVIGAFAAIGAAGTGILLVRR